MSGDAAIRLSHEVPYSAMKCREVLDLVNDDIPRARSLLQGAASCQSETALDSLIRLLMQHQEWSQGARQ